MDDAYAGKSSALAFGPAVIAADTTPAAIDIRGYSEVLIELDIGVGGITFSDTNRVDFKLTHCDTEGGSYTAVTLADLVGLASVADGGIVRSLVAAHAAATTQIFSYVGNKGFLKFGPDFGGTHGTGTPMCGKVLRGKAHVSPVVT